MDGDDAFDALTQELTRQNAEVSQAKHEAYRLNQILAEAKKAMEGGSLSAAAFDELKRRNLYLIDVQKAREAAAEGAIFELKSRFRNAPVETLSRLWTRFLCSECFGVGEWPPSSKSAKEKARVCDRCEGSGKRELWSLLDDQDCEKAVLAARDRALEAEILKEANLLKRLREQETKGSIIFRGLSDYDIAMTEKAIANLKALREKTKQKRGTT